MASVLHFVFGIFGNVTALFLFLSPMITFHRIIKSRSTEEFSGVPYVSTLMNCLLSGWYGLPFISPNNLLVSTINFTGAGIELVYVFMFLFYAPKKIKAKIFTLFALVIAAFAAIALVSVFALHGSTRKFFCGVAATIFSICMYASPLSIMRLVIKTKSVEFMPFFLSLFVFLCGTSWFIFGLLGGDPFVSVPNGFGCFLGTLQLILYFIYRDWGSKKTGSDSEVYEKGHQKDRQIHEKESSMEMGYANGSNKTNEKEKEKEKEKEGEIDMSLIGLVYFPAVFASRINSDRLIDGGLWLIGRWMLFFKL